MWARHPGTQKTSQVPVALYLYAYSSGCLLSYTKVSRCTQSLHVHTYIHTYIHLYRRRRERERERERAREGGREGGRGEREREMYTEFLNSWRPARHMHRKVCTSRWILTFPGPRSSTLWAIQLTAWASGSQVSVNFAPSVGNEFGSGGVSCRFGVSAFSCWHCGLLNLRHGHWIPCFHRNY